MRTSKLNCSIQIRKFYTCGPINRKFVFLILEINDFIMQMIVLFELLPSMKTFLKIDELKYCRNVNEYRVFYSENTI